MTSTEEGTPVAAVSDAPASRRVLFDFDGVLLRGDAFGLFARSRLRGVRRGLALLLCVPLLPTLPFTRRWALRACVPACSPCWPVCRRRATAPWPRPSARIWRTSRAAFIARD